MIVELPLKYDATRAAIGFLEKQGYSIVEWFDFDMTDSSTWPSHTRGVLVKTSQGIIEALIVFDEEFAEFSGYDGDIELGLDDVICWCEIPQQKESK
jgi:hypothetical protein